MPNPGSKESRVSQSCWLLLYILGLLPLKTRRSFQDNGTTVHLPFPNMIIFLTVSQWDFFPGQTEILKYFSFILRNAASRSCKKERNKVSGHMTAKAPTLSAATGPSFHVEQCLWLERSRAWNPKTFCLINLHAISLPKEQDHFIKSQEQPRAVMVNLSKLPMITACCLTHAICSPHWSRVLSGRKITHEHLSVVADAAVNRT